MTARAVAGLAALLVVGAACARGPLPGRLTLPGKSPEPARLNYESGVLGSTGKLWTTLPDGEEFKGQYRLEPRNPERAMTGTLSSAAGRTLVCRFQLKEPGIGPDGGGSYRCELSTGGVLEGEF